MNYLFACFHTVSVFYYRRAHATCLNMRSYGLCCLIAILMGTETYFRISIRIGLHITDAIYGFSQSPCLSIKAKILQ